MAHKSDDEEYRALCELVNSIYQGLPPGWAWLIFQDMRLGVPGDIAVRRQLLRVSPELRIRMEGLDAWLSLPDEYVDGCGRSGDENDGVEDEDEDAKEAEGSDHRRNEAELSGSHTEAHRPLGCDMTIQDSVRVEAVECQPSALPGVPHAFSQLSILTPSFFLRELQFSSPRHPVSRALQDSGTQQP